ncbi:preprotein translocase subunit SecG [Acidithiobacillus ferrianus]|uniref:Protein-export membrane protein SecG n=2 Tax=Acidithiobacillus ferrianus TaxID=2678518 RepID=A0A845UHG9_9PROT|nr:preprotein translocase subunit SecG [Acidithiobacillus ferrianus]NDU43294.1 preprotein translocase subunit SecG [Acidithiobacillus ferrianus]
MYTVLLVFQVVICIVLVGLVLIQKGQGADIGAVFGGGSQTVFGARGAGNFLSHATAVIGAVFFLNSLGLAYLSDHSSGSVVGAGIALPENAPAAAQPSPALATAPMQSATPGAAAATVSPASVGKTSGKP